MTYEGFDVLQVEPNGSGSWQDNWSQPVRELNSPTGRFRNVLAATTAVVDKPFRWFLHGRDSVEAFMQWLDERKGRLVPFWAPTWRWDLTVLGDVQAGAEIIPIKKIGYAASQLWSPARRHLAIFTTEGIVPLYAHDATLEADRELLWFHDEVPVDLPAGSGLSFLVLYRLMDDNVMVHWLTPTLAEVVLRMREVPHELPTV
jgi:hypothetical protein